MPQSVLVIVESELLGGFNPASLASRFYVEIVCKERANEQTDKARVEQIIPNQILYYRDDYE